MIGDIHQVTKHPIRLICASLEVPRSSYYHAAKPTPTQISDLAMGDRVEAIFRSHRRRYGYRRIQSDLRDEGLICAPARVRRLMKERGLKAIQPRTYAPQTSDGRADLPSPNLLIGQPLPSQPNQVWAGDITYIPTAAGWLYLAVVIDLCSRRIVGWALADHLRASLVCDALRQALGSRSIAPEAAGPIFHSDRGSQYGSGAFRQLLETHKLTQSMSARANPYHNAWTESFMGTLKAEMLQDGTFIDAHDARTEIFAYIDAYYNTRRKHSSLAYKTPFQFESNLSQNN
jgi:putative transposase